MNIRLCKALWVSMEFPYFLKKCDLMRMYWRRFAMLEQTPFALWQICIPYPIALTALISDLTHCCWCCCCLYEYYEWRRVVIVGRMTTTRRRRRHRTEADIMVGFLGACRLSVGTIRWCSLTLKSRARAVSFKRAISFESDKNGGNRHDDEKPKPKSTQKSTQHQLACTMTMTSIRRQR